MSEALNLRVDENDTPLGGATRAELHEHGYWHRIVGVWLINPDGRIILQRRLLSKKLDGGKLDSSASGHVDFDDWDPEDDSTTNVKAVRREAGEELGIVDIKNLQEIASWKVEESDTLGGVAIRRFIRVYLGETDKRVEDIKVKPDELETVVDVSMDDFAAMIVRDDPELVEGVKTAFKVWQTSGLASYQLYYGKADSI